MSRYAHAGTRPSLHRLLRIGSADFVAGDNGVAKAVMFLP